MAAVAVGAQGPQPSPGRTGLDRSLIVTQLPVGTAVERRGVGVGHALPASYGDGGRIIAVAPDGSTRVLTRGFHGACDPDVSFDGRRLLFAAKRAASDHWNIFELALDGSMVRQVTRDQGNCRSPVYQSTLYTIISTEPWYQLTFVSDAADTMTENGSGLATHLYSCKLDGSAVRRLTFNLSSDRDPFLLADGRLLFSSWQRSRLDHGLLGRVGLFGVNIDGADFARYASERGRRVKLMPCATSRGLVVFVESDDPPWDGAGRLSSVKMRRPLHWYEPITNESDGWCHSPSPLADGTILVSRRPDGAGGTHGVWRLDPRTRRWWPVYDDPHYHDIQAKIVRSRAEPDGRSSVVTEDDPNGKLYCLNVYLTDLEDRNWMPRGVIRRLRVLEGVPLGRPQADVYLPATHGEPAVRPGSTVHGLPPLVQRRILGEIDVAEDGSLNIEVPANTPIQLQTLDGDGMALRSCGWIWAKNHEPRGCIGCHEDGEATPENVFVDAATRPSIPLTLPPKRRRTVDFRRDVMPIVDGKCVACHGPKGAPPRLDSGLRPVQRIGGKASFNRAYVSLLALDPSSDQSAWRGKYVQPGSARTSPVVWHIFGRNTARPWDGDVALAPAAVMPAGKVEPLTADERRTLVEWIDMGAMWDGIPDEDDVPK